MSKMLSVEAARARIIAPLTPVAVEIVSLSDAWRRVLAAPVTARTTLPPADMSAMDGYALRAEDGTLGARLTVVGTAPAGHPFRGTIGPGETVRLYTGSVVPEGADTILLQEDADATEGAVTIREATRPARHIRPRGQDFFAGDTVLAPGRRLGARDIGLAAAANAVWLNVHRRPRVAILATGDEVAMPGEDIPDGGIVSSNSHALSAMVRAAGGEPILLPVAADDAGAIASLAGTLGGIDLLVTTGGVSVGDYDLVREGLGAQGFTMDFWRIAMRPGKPLMSGMLGAVPVLGLPGNPVSALVCGVLFLLPALGRLSGDSGTGTLPVVQARLGAELRENDHRADHLRASLSADAEGRLIATPFERQDSGMISFLARADALVLRPPGAPPAQAGAIVDIIRLDTMGL